MKLCPLCDNLVESFHRRSHIIPEWMYSECYDENHKVLEASRTKQKMTKKQKGSYGSFICSDCETETQKYDRYASLILTNRSQLSNESRAVFKKYFREKANGEYHEYSKWDNLNFLFFQKFVFSIILRAHFSGKIEGEISLSKKHLECLLSLYRDTQNQNDLSYPIFILEFPSNDPHKNHVVLPYFKKQDGHHILEFSGGGYLFNVYISSHAKPKHVISLRLKNDGSMYLIRMAFNETGLFKNLSKLVNNLKNVSDF